MFSLEISNGNNQKTENAKDELPSSSGQTSASCTNVIPKKYTSKGRLEGIVQNLKTRRTASINDKEVLKDDKRKDENTNDENPGPSRQTNESCKKKRKGVSVKYIAKMKKSNPGLEENVDQFGSEKHHHLNLHNSKKNHVCDFCNKKFANAGNLKNHRNLHTRDVSYSCNMCDKSFLSTALLNYHMKKHTGNYAFKCSHCPKKFVQKSNFQDHLNMHTGEKNYKCDVCDKRFGIRSNLKQHKLVHSDEKPYACECGRRFKHKCNLVQHKLMHSDEKPHACKCGRRYKDKGNLKKHKRSKICEYSQE